MAKPEFITMARAALNYTKKRSTWEVFLRGYSSTNQRGSATERDILEGLWKNFPTVDALRAACPMDAVPRWDRDNPEVGSGLQNLRSRTGAARDLCKVPDLWDELAFLLRCPDEDHQRRVKNFSLGAREGNPNKRIANMRVGLSTKGADMTMLWGGCEVPVIDIWMLRLLTPMVKELGGQSWGELVKSTLREMRRDGFDLDLKVPGAPKEFSNVVPASEIDENNASHVAGGNGYVQAFIQSKPQFYGYYRDAAYRQAEAEGLPANVWHVATWIELIQSQKYDKDGNAISINRDDYDTWLNNPGDTDTKADKQAVRKSRDFLNTLRLPLPEPYGPASHVDMSMISFNVPDEFHNEIEGGDHRLNPRKPNPTDEKINFDIGGIEIYLDYDNYSKEFNLDISRQFGEPSVQDFRRVRELVYALLRENPGSAFEIRAMGEQRRKVYERVGFEVIKASQLRSGVMFQMRLAGVPSAYRGEEPGTPEWFKEQISLVMRGQTGQTLSTEAALDMLRQIRSKAGAYSDIVELIDQHIESLERFGARYIPYIQEEEVRRGEELCRGGQCYSNVYAAAMDNWDSGGDAVSEDIRIVHGRVRMWTLDETTDTKHPGYGGHAWVEIEDKVYDPTTGSVIDKEKYYELLEPIVDYKLSPLAANFLNIQHNNDGPYHPMTLVMANFENIDDDNWDPKNEILIVRPHNLDEDDNFDWVDTRVDLPKMPEWMLNPGDEPGRHSFTDLSGLSRYAADIEALVS